MHLLRHAIVMLLLMLCSYPSFHQPKSSVIQKHVLKNLDEKKRMYKKRIYKKRMYKKRLYEKRIYKNRTKKRKSIMNPSHEFVKTSSRR